MPIVTIARGTLSGGQATAERVAEQLGYRCVGRETLVELASKFGVPVPRMNEMLESTPRFWERLTESREAYAAYLEAAMGEIVQQGDLVYHGMLGQELLKGVTSVLRVRVIAPMAYRVAAAMEAQHVNREAAAQYINRADEDRLRRVKYLFGVDWRDAALYDLVVNLEQINEDTAADLIVSLARSPRFQPTPESQRSIENFVLASRVNAALVVNGWSVDVEAEDGTIRLRGEIQLASPDEPDDVVRVVKDLPGVKKVESDLTLLPVSPVLPL